MGQNEKVRRHESGSGCSLVLPCFCLCSAFYRPRETFSITALDVGQGDSLVVESGRL